MRRAIAAACACAVVAATAMACEKITHVADFQTGTPPEPDTGAPAEQSTPADEICRRCPGSSADLRRPPCPTEGTGDDGEHYVYAWRSLKLGVDSDPTKTLEPTSYDPQVGYDFDCSDRMPTGLPAKCAAIIPDGGPEAETPWKPYPKGIDNALAQRFLGPLYVKAHAFDDTTQPLDVLFSQQLEQGHGSILTIVYHWNGLPDDKKVSVRIVSGFGTADGNPPKWDGTDKWIAATAKADPDQLSDQVPLVNSKTDDAYIAQGVLVVDFSKIAPLYNHIVNGGVALYVPLFDMHMVANIAKDKSKLTYQQFFGRWPLSDFRKSNDDIAAFLAACDPVKLGALRRALPGLSSSAADFLIDDTMPADTLCDALTVTWAANAERASIGGYKEFPSTPTPCP